MLYLCCVPVVQDARNQTGSSTHISALSHLHNHQYTPQQLQQQQHHNRYTLLNCIERQFHLQQCGKFATHPPHHITMLRIPTPSSITQDVHPTLPIISRYFLGSRRFDMTKKKDLSLLEKNYTPAIPHNSGGRRQARESGIITGCINNCNRRAHLKITPTNKKFKGKGKAPTKSASSSTSETKKTPATNPPPKKIPPPRTSGRKYANWKQDTVKSVLVRSVEAKLKVLDTQLSAGGVIIPDGTLQDHVRYAKEKSKKRGLSSITTWRISRERKQKLSPLSCTVSTSSNWLLFAT